MLPGSGSEPARTQTASRYEPCTKAEVCLRTTSPSTPNCRCFLLQRCLEQRSISKSSGPGALLFSPLLTTFNMDSSTLSPGGCSMTEKVKPIPDGFHTITPHL